MPMSRDQLSQFKRQFSLYQEQYVRLNASMQRGGRSEADMSVPYPGAGGLLIRDSQLLN